MRNFTVIVLLGVLTASGYAQNSVYGSSPNGDIISKYRHLLPKQLLDTANYYYNSNSNDTALICYSLIINTPVYENDTVSQKLAVEALNKTGVIYRRVCDYRRSYELFIKALDLCEQYRYDEYMPKIYSNIGNIYIRFNRYDVAKQWYLQALSLCKNSIDSLTLFNNMGVAELESGKTDSIFNFFNHALQISRRHSNIHSESILNNIALYHQKAGVYDSAFHYFRQSLAAAKRNSKIESEAGSYYCLAKLLMETGEADSAQFYIHTSNRIAAENSFLRISAENYLVLSQIAEHKAHYKSALEHLKTYANLKDSLFDVDKFGEINQLQRLHEVSKTNQHIEQLVVEKRIKEHTIRIILGVLALVISILIYVFIQKKKLNTAYKTLVEKNLKILELQDSTTEKYPINRPPKALADTVQSELLNKIMTQMEDTAVICDVDFSLNKLAELVQSNHNYVSDVINNTLKKNFRTFLNDYRILEAQRLFSEPDAVKYTIEWVALRVGFRSRNTFSDNFRKVTGVSPNFYLKQMQQRRNQ